MLDTLEDDRDGELLVVSFPYFETDEPSGWVDETTYTGDDARVSAPVSHEWAHAIREAVQAVLDAGLTLTRVWRNTPSSSGSSSTGWCRTSTAGGSSPTAASDCP